MSELIIESSDFIHEVIYKVSANADDVKFPLYKIVRFLMDNQYEISLHESSNYSYILYKDENKVTVTEMFISFVALEPSLREPYRQKFYKYLISRSKIFYESAVHNISAAKINLIQNQRRPCLSNMYYALHNSLSSLIESYRNEIMSDDNLEVDFSGEEEAKIDHFNPDLFQVYLNNIDTLLNKSEETFLEHKFMHVNRTKIHENPYTWIIPVFSQHVNDDNFKKVILAMHDSLKIVNLNNLGADSESRRSVFESKLKVALDDVKNELTDSDSPKNSYLILSAFFSYGYMLRQSADYDSLFDVKIPYKEIINWTIVTSNFLDFIEEIYFKENRIDSESSASRIQKLDAKSSLEILKNHEIDYQNNLMTITGIIIDKSFDFGEIIKKLYSNKGYKLMNQMGTFSELKSSTENITLCKKLFGTTLECYISISIQGLFRIDVEFSKISKHSDIYKTINYYYLEELINRELVNKDLQAVISQEASIVIGLPSINQNRSVAYNELILRLFEGNKNRITREINKDLKNMTNAISTSKFIISSRFQLNNSSNFLINGPSERFLFDFLEREKKYAQAIDGEIEKILFVYFYFHNEAISVQKNQILDRLTNEYPLVNFSIELIQLTDGEIRKLIEEDYDYLTAKLITLKNQFETSTAELSLDDLISSNSNS
ncbi:hypothetical protein [Exiguobacterium sp. SL-9]|uniref:hypothetical protein n=1 Tax=Exiguobacterium sp. SL-9 TaxID=2510963 RepID=UPI00103ABA6B|nr:hypothetical protein [Exiguobacterium sp. SL-9]TCI22841.1 hypothetical protein EVJ34_00005 [Exiguobacterium sp. SL-9]